MTEPQLRTIAEQFALDAPIVAIERLGEGFINDTFVVNTLSTRYILQRKNSNVFEDVPAMMDNIARVTAHLKRKVLTQGGDPEREVLTVVPTTEGALYHIHDGA